MKDYSRRLHVTVSGRWYVGLTIIIGVVAITTGNNSIYVMESLLLSGLILSGILSEQVIISVDAEVKRTAAIADNSQTNGDLIVVTNYKNRHLFCLEIGEWIKGDFLPIAWIPHLKPKQTLAVKSRRIYKNRGIHSWEAIAIATRFPFGFARKIRFKNTPGTRIVWPPAIKTSRQSNLEFKKKQKAQAGTILQQNDVRSMLPDDDFRLVVWTLSNKGTDLVVRTRKSRDNAPEIILDLRCKAGLEFEKKISLAALPFYQLNDTHIGTLTLIDSQGRKTLHGKMTILNKLAVVQAEESETSVS